MTDQRRIPPKRQKQYDLLNQDDKAFEAMVARLVRLQYPEAFKPANTGDGGADMVLQGARGRPGHERCWQAKHYPNRIGWPKCKNSLAAAKKHWQPRHYTFVFPRDLTVTEQKTFRKHFGGEDFTVDYWNGDRIQGLLTSSPEGERVARNFFEDVELDKENINRAIEVSGRLDTPEDALDRLSNVGGYLASSDAYFSYPSSIQETDGPGHTPAKGSVMSFSSTEDQVTSRIDIVPRDEEAMERYGPEFRVSATDDEVGRAAAERLVEALREGKEVEIGEGLEVTPTRMPPAFEDIVGETITGSVRLGPVERIRPKAHPWRARLTSRADDEEASISVRLAQTKEVPAGWDDSFVGDFGGMSVQLLLREFDSGGGEVRFNFRHRRDSSPVRQQLRALNFMRVLGLGGEIAVEGEGRPMSTTPVAANPLPADSAALITFLEDVRTIEEWTGIEFRLPDEIQPEDAQTVAYLARWMRRGGSNVTWEPFEAAVTDVSPLRNQRLLALERAVGAKLFGREVGIGFTRLELSQYNVVDLGPAEDNPEAHSVRIEPTDASEGRAFEVLTKEKVTAPKAKTKKPPPPPRKSKGRKSGRRRSKRSK